MQEKPSILFVLPWKPSSIGGANQVVNNLVRETIRHGRLHPIVAYNDWEQDEFQLSEIDGVTHVSVHLHAALGDQQPARNLAGFALKMRKDIAAWRTFVAQHDVQVVNAHFVTPGCLLFALLRTVGRTRFRLVFSLHGADLAEAEAGGAASRASYRWMLRQSDRVVCCSESLTTQARTAFKLDESLVDTVYNGADPEPLEQALDHAYRPDMGQFDNYLLCVGRFCEEKGHDVLLEAYVQLVREGLQSALVMIGQSTPYLAALRSKVKRNGLQDHVVLITDLDHPRTLAAIDKARLLVQPSREEPFGMPLLEAAYLRTPVVATSAGGIPEVLGAYYPYLAKPGDVETLARGIDDALFNPTETERQVRLLKRRLPARFTSQQTYHAYEHIWVGKA